MASSSQHFDFDVFISYRQQEPDISWVREKLLPGLEAEGISVFIDFREFKLGKTVLEEMQRGVRQSRYTLVVATSAYHKSGFTNFEKVIAELSETDGDNDDRLIVVSPESGKLPSLSLRSQLYMDMSDDAKFETNCKKLRSTLKPRLFVVYSDTDEIWVSKYLKPALGQAPCIIEKKLFTQGEFKLKETEQAITDSDHILLILSPAFFDDKWASKVYKLASHQSLEDPDKQPILLHLTTCELSADLKARVSLDFTRSTEWSKEIVRLLEILGLPNPEPISIECPYPGMVRFDEDNARFFYGRDDDINKALGKLRHQNFLFVIGPSGSGKSSLVFAGVVPVLKERDPHKWLVRSFRPGNVPLDNLKTALALPNPPPHTDSKEIIDATYISALLVKHPPAEQLFLIIDQLEELFTLANPEQQASFFSCIKTLFSMQTCTIILTMRADFYPDLMKSDLWLVAQGARQEVTTLTGDRLAEALEKPANDKGVYLEEGLRERLLADASEEPGALPLIQEVMQLLWQQREQHLLTLDGYKQLGSDGQTGLAVALSNKADGTLNSLPSEQHRTIARRLFLRLIHFGEGRSDTRRPQMKSALHSQGEDQTVFDETIEHLTANRLLTQSSEANTSDNESCIKVDISHEALIMGWSLLQEWITDRRDSELIRRRLEEQVRNWEGLKKTGGLLDEEELLRAEKWVKTEDARNLGYSSGLRQLISVSKKAIDHVRNAHLRRVLYATFALSILLMATLWKLGESEHHRQNARVSKLAVTAELIRDKSPDQLPLSLLIAIEAITPELGTDISNWLWIPTQKIENWIGNLIFGQTNTLHGKHILRKNLGVMAEPKTPLLYEDSSVKAIDYSPNGKLIAIASGSEVCIWDTTNVQKISCLPHNKKVISLVFGNNNSHIYTTSRDKQVHGWNAKTGELLWASTNTKSVKTITLNNKGNLLAGASGINVQIWHTRDGNKGSVFPHKYPVKAIAFATDSEFLAVAYGDKIVIWDIVSKKKQHTFSLASPASSLVFSPNGRFLAATTENAASVWDIRIKKKYLDAKHKGSVDAIAFDSTSEHLATGGINRTARVWKLSDKSQIFSMEHGQREQVISFEAMTIHPPGGVQNIAFSKDGKYLATASSDKTARIWDLESGKEFLRIVHDAPVKRVIFAPNGGTVATASMSGARIWGLNRGDELVRLNHESIVTKVSFSHDGRYLCTKDASANAHTWEYNHGKKISKNDHLCATKVLPIQESEYKSIIKGNEVYLMHGNKEIARVHHNDVESSSISSDGKFLATSGWGWVQIWELSSRGLLFWETLQFNKLSRLTNDQRGINHMAFSPDNRYLATAGTDKTVRVWLWQDTDMVERACKRLSRNLSQSQWKEHIGDGDYRKTCPELPSQD